MQNLHTHTHSRRTPQGDITPSFSSESFSFSVSSQWDAHSNPAERKDPYRSFAFMSVNVEGSQRGFMLSFVCLVVRLELRSFWNAIVYAFALQSVNALLRNPER